MCESKNVRIGPCACEAPNILALINPSRFCARINRTLLNVATYFSNFSPKCSKLNFDGLFDFYTPIDSAHKYVKMQLTKVGKVVDKNNVREEIVRRPIQNGMN